MRMLQHCFAVKLQKCFVDYETQSDVHQHGGEQIMTEFSLLGELIL